MGRRHCLLLAADLAPVPKAPATANSPVPCDLCTCCARQVIEDFGLLSFHPLAIEDRDSVRALVALIDKANGYVFAGLKRQGGSPKATGEQPGLLELGG